MMWPQAPEPRAGGTLPWSLWQECGPVSPRSQTPAPELGPWIWVLSPAVSLVGQRLFWHMLPPPPNAPKEEALDKHPANLSSYRKATRIKTKNTACGVDTDPFPKSWPCRAFPPVLAVGVWEALLSVTFSDLGAQPAPAPEAPYGLALAPTAQL